MKQNKSELMRFEILKILLKTSTHGYQIYLFLSERGLVKDVSECYKNIRSLKEAGLIQDMESSSIPGLSGEDASNQNSSKKTLKITEKGIHAYYEWIYNSLLVFLDFIEEMRRTSITTDIENYLTERGIKLDSIVHKSIFFAFHNFPVGWQEGIITKFLLPLAETNAIYLQTKSEISADLMKLLSLKRPHLTVLTDALRLSADSIDFIFDFNAPYIEAMEETLVQLNSLLKEGGQLMMFVPKLPVTPYLPLFSSEESGVDDSGNQQTGWKDPFAAQNVVNAFLKQIPENLQENYAKKLLPFLDLSISPSQIEFPTIYAALRSIFPNVTPFMGKNHFNFLLALKYNQELNTQASLVEYSFPS